jgi:hypothetical protein
MAQKTEGDERLGLRAATDYTQLSQSTLRHYVATGRLPATRTPNGRLWFDKAALESLFEPVEVKSELKQGNWKSPLESETNK